MRTANNYRALAMDDFFQNDRVVVSNGHAIKATIDDIYKGEKIYAVICPKRKGDIVELAGEDTVFHVKD